MTAHHASRSGLACALGAYGFWGFIPLYFKQITDVAPSEVLSYRILWSFAVLAVVMSLWGNWSQWKALVSDRRTVALLSISTLLIAANWLAFIYAVSIGEVLQSSLGYFLTPLCNVLLGVLFLGERLRRAQAISFGLAAVGVAIPTWMLGHFPWLAITLAVSFSLYGLMKKVLPVSALAGLTIETLLLAPLAAAYLFWIGGGDASTAAATGKCGWLALSGIVTTVPLLLFAEGARRLPLSVLAVVQYLTPSLQFLVAVFLFGEEMPPARIASFCIVWLAIALYLYDWYRAADAARRLPPVAYVE